MPSTLKLLYEKSTFLLVLVPVEYAKETKSVRTCHILDGFLPSKNTTHSMITATEGRVSLPSFGKAPQPNIQMNKVPITSIT